MFMLQIIPEQGSKFTRLHCRLTEKSISLYLPWSL